MSEYKKKFDPVQPRLEDATTDEEKAIYDEKCPDAFDRDFIHWLAGDRSPSSGEKKQNNQNL